VRVFEVRPADFGYRAASLESLRGGDADANARIILDVLEGRRRDEARELVAANAAAALTVGGLADGLEAGAALAEKSIDEGAALGALESLRRVTNA
jgi:anthranilate phosphoribosyltransferase